jgi:hypothetical protein
VSEPEQQEEVQAVDPLRQLITSATPRGGMARLEAVRCRVCDRVELFSPLEPGDTRWKATGRGWRVERGVFYCRRCKP